MQFFFGELPARPVPSLRQQGLSEPAILLAKANTVEDKVPLNQPIHLGQGGIAKIGVMLLLFLGSQQCAVVTDAIVVSHLVLLHVEPRTE